MHSPGDAQQKQRAAHAWGVHRAARLLLCAAALTAGYFIGAHGYVAQALGQHTAPLTPLARVGFAVQSDQLRGESADWQRLQRDLKLVRAEWEPPTRGILDLVVAVRGLENDLQPEWERAERLCRELSWPRCDRPALEELRRRSRP